MDWGQNWPYRSEDLQNKGHEGPLITCSKYHLVSSMPPTDYKYYTPISCKFLSWQTLIGSPPFFLVISPAIWEVEVMGDRPGWPCLYRLARTETPARYTRYLCKYVWEVEVMGDRPGWPCLARTKTPARYTCYLCKHVWELKVMGGRPGWPCLRTETLPARYLCENVL